MVVDLRRFFDRLSLRPGASDAAITGSEKQLGAALPTEYVQYLRFTNGGEGFIGKEYVIFWSVEDLASLNQSYEVQKYTPGLLIFGSNGGGEAYGFDTRTPQWPIVQVPLIGMDWGYARPIGESFTSFLGNLHEAKINE